MTRILPHAVCLYDLSGHTHKPLVAHPPPELFFTVGREEKAGVRRVKACKRILLEGS